MDLSRDRLILELEPPLNKFHSALPKARVYTMGMLVLGKCKDCIYLRMAHKAEACSN
jgi:hypothetical protein